MSNKNYNNFYNQKPAETPNTPAEEIKELEQEIPEGEENLNPESPVVEQNENLEVDETEEDEETPEDETEEDEETTEDETEEDEETPEDETEEISETKNVQLVRVAVGSLNIRKAADKESDIITVVKKDDELELRESTSIDGFYAVKTKNGTFGYCMVDFVELV